MGQQSTCRKCGKELATNALFCQHCGAKVSTGYFTATNDPYLGTTIDNTFVVESILGTGSMGIVYKARHRALDCYVAIKILKTDFLDNRVVLTRFQREAQAASGIQHPNVIRILHYGKTAMNAPYIAMECLEGEDLSDIIVRDFPFSQARVGQIILQVAQALKAAHEARIIHRDLKPANIKVVPQNDGTPLVKVLDFGIAKLTDERGEGLTRDGSICGTPAFMSPEQVLGNTVSPASDLFSLGSIMYFMLTCKLPFQGNTMVDMASSILTSNPTKPSQARIDVYIDPKLEEICMRALEKDVAKRYQHAEDVIRDLEDALKNISEASSPKPHKGIVIGEAEEGLDTEGCTRCAFSAYDSVQNQSTYENAPSPVVPPMPKSSDKLEDVSATSVDAEEFSGKREINSDECTIIDQRAYQDDEEGATSVHMSAVADAVPLSALGVPDNNVNPHASTASVNAVNQPAPVELKRASANFVALNAASQSIDANATLDGEGKPVDPIARAKWERNHKKKLMFMIVGGVACICTLFVIVVVLLNLLMDDSKKPTDTDHVITESNTLPKAENDEPVLSQLEISQLSDVVASAAYDQVVWTTSYGIAFDAAVGEVDEEGDGAEGKPADVADKPSVQEPKRVAAPVKRAESKPVARPAATKPSTTKTTSKKSSVSAKKRIADAQSAEDSGNMARACSIYKSVVSDPSLSKEDRLKVQTKIRKCGRVVL